MSSHFSVSAIENHCLHYHPRRQNQIKKPQLVTPAGVPPAAEPKETTQPALAPEVLAPAEAAPKEPYKAGDIMREEDYDPARLSIGYSFEQGRITGKDHMCAEKRSTAGRLAGGLVFAHGSTEKCCSETSL